MSKNSSRYSRKPRLSPAEKRAQAFDKAVHAAKVKHHRDTYAKLGLGKLYGIKTSNDNNVEV